MRKILLSVTTIVVATSCGSMKGLMDKLQGKLTPEGEKVAIVYAQTGNEFIDYSFDLEKLPRGLNKCKVIKKELKVPFRGGIQYYESMITMTENALRNEAGLTKGANVVVPVKRDVEQEGDILSGTVTGKALNCNESVRKCKMYGNCSYKNTASSYVNRIWKPVNGKHLSATDNNLSMAMNVRDDSLVIFLNFKNKIGKVINIDSGKIISHGPYGRNRHLTLMGDREIDPKESGKLSAAMNISRNLPVCGTPKGQILGGRAVTNVDDKFCVGEKFTLELKYGIENGARKKIKLPFTLAGRVAIKN